MLHESQDSKKTFSSKNSFVTENASNQERVKVPAEPVIFSEYDNSIHQPVVSFPTHARGIQDLYYGSKRAILQARGRAVTNPTTISSTEYQHYIHEVYTHANQIKEQADRIVFSSNERRPLSLSIYTPLSFNFPKGYVRQSSPISWNRSSSNVLDHSKINDVDSLDSCIPNHRKKIAHPLTNLPSHATSYFTNSYNNGYKPSAHYAGINNNFASNSKFEKSNDVFLKYESCESKVPEAKNKDSSSSCIILDSDDDASMDDTDKEIAKSVISSQNLSNYDNSQMQAFDDSSEVIYISDCDEDHSKILHNETADGETLDNGLVFDETVHNGSDNSEINDSESVSNETIHSEDINSGLDHNESLDNEEIHIESVDNETTYSESICSEEIPIESGHNELAVKETFHSGLVHNKLVNIDTITNELIHIETVHNEVDDNKTVISETIHSESILSEDTHLPLCASNQISFKVSPASSTNDSYASEDLSAEENIVPALLPIKEALGQCMSVGEISGSSINLDDDEDSQSQPTSSDNDPWVGIYGARHYNHSNHCPHHECTSDCHEDEKSDSSIRPVIDENNIITPILSRAAGDVYPIYTDSRISPQATHPFWRFDSTVSNQILDTQENYHEFTELELDGDIHKNSQLLPETPCRDQEKSPDRHSLDSEPTNCDIKLSQSMSLRNSPHLTDVSKDASISLSFDGNDRCKDFLEHCDRQSIGRVSPLANVTKDTISLAVEDENLNRGQYIVSWLSEQNPQHYDIVASSSTLPLVCDVSANVTKSSLPSVDCYSADGDIECEQATDHDQVNDSILLISCRGSSASVKSVSINNKISTGDQNSIFSKKSASIVTKDEVLEPDSEMSLDKESLYAQNDDSSEIGSVHSAVEDLQDDIVGSITNIQKLPSISGSDLEDSGFENSWYSDSDEYYDCITEFDDEGNEIVRSVRRGKKRRRRPSNYREILNQSRELTELGPLPREVSTPYSLRRILPETSHDKSNNRRLSTGPTHTTSLTRANATPYMLREPHEIRHTDSQNQSAQETNIENSPKIRRSSRVKRTRFQ